MDTNYREVKCYVVKADNKVLKVFLDQLKARKYAKGHQYSMVQTSKLRVGELDEN